MFIINYGIKTEWGLKRYHIQLKNFNLKECSLKLNGDWKGRKRSKPLKHELQLNNIGVLAYKLDDMFDGIGMSPNCWLSLSN